MAQRSLTTTVRLATALALVGTALWGVGSASQGRDTSPGSTTARVTAQDVGDDAQQVPDGTGNLAEDIRILLLRSYVPADGRMAIDADPPTITVVKKRPGTARTRAFELPDCPKRITSARVFTDLFNDTTSQEPEEFFDDMADMLEEAGPIGRLRNPFPHCSWWARINTSVYADRDYDRSDPPIQDGMNIFLPDSNATYWAVPFNASQEPDRRGLVLDHIEIEGQFQEQLFMSHVIYDSSMDFYYYENDDGTVCQSYNTDYQIDPDDGSVNPWQVDSQDYDDTYTVRLEFEPEGTDCSGGGPGVHASAGTNFNVLPLSRTDSGYGPDNTSQVNMVQGDFFGEGASETVSRSSNGCAYLGADTRPCALPHMFVAPTDGAQNSVWSNPVAGYLAAGFIPEPGFVYVYRGKAPRVPKTASPVPWADDGLADYDMRYFSLCVDKKIWPYPAQDANWSCANGSYGSGVYDPDDNPDGLTELKIGDDGYWTVILSTDDLADNPQVGDATVLKVSPLEPVAFILRHMVVQDSFTTSVPSTPRDGAWPSASDQMQDYYPVETVICNKAQFDANGWTDGGCFVPPVND